MGGPSSLSSDAMDQDQIEGRDSKRRSTKETEHTADWDVEMREEYLMVGEHSQQGKVRWSSNGLSFSNKVRGKPTSLKIYIGEDEESLEEEL